ncbi:MAG: YceI family protein [Candidatus Tectomicrobia bacterium]|nr:YceI family protein [Candidatus Tectomicrobia bacterium]
MIVKRLGMVIVALLISLGLTGGALAADEYMVDNAHAAVSFVVRHLVISKVRGQFEDFDAKLLINTDDITKSSMQGAIKVASINTDNEKRDKHLRSPDFFDADQHPEIMFVSKRIEKNGDGYVMIGDFTIRGVTKEIALPFTITEPIVHGKKTRVGFEAELEIDRQDYGIAYSKVADTGGLVVGNEVKIEINGEAIKKE